MNGIKRVYTIRANNDKEAEIIMDSLHCQLAGNEDYIKSNIVLNDSFTRRDYEDANIIRVTIYDECSEIPELVLS